MSEITGRPASADHLGVVDSIRIPGLGPAGAAWNALPRLGQVFVALTIVDIVGRITGLLGDRIVVDPAIPVTLLYAVVPHDLLILLPTLLLWRRRDAATATPLILGGAIALAIAEFASAPLARLAFGGPAGPVASWTAVSIVTTVAKAGAWVAMAVGLARLNPPFPTRFIGGLANLIGGLIAAGGFVGLALLFAAPASGIGDPDWDGLLFLASSMTVLETVAIAVLARAIVRGLGDQRRPVAATALASAGVAGHAVVSFLGVVAGLIALVQVVFALSGATVGGSVAAVMVQLTIAPTLIVVGFALGLADTSVRIPGRGERGFAPQPQPDPIHWPTSFEEENVPYHPELVPTREAAPAEPKRGRGRSPGRGGRSKPGKDRSR